MDSIRVLVADDHPVVREGTRNLLERQPDMHVVGEASDGEEAVRLTKDVKPDVVIMDIAMPKIDGVEATRQIKSSCPSVTVLILSAYDDDPYVFALVDAGAAGYLLKNARGTEVVDAVRAVRSGESVLSPQVARKVLNRFKPTEGGQQTVGDILSEREVEVLRLLTRGLTNKEVANELSVSGRTVQAHLAHMFNKLGVGSRMEAVILALKGGWVTLDETM